MNIKPSTLEVSLKFLITKDNLHDIDNFKELAKELGIKNIQFKYARNSINSVETNVGKTNLEVPYCKANLLSSFINARGDVFICCYYQGREKEHCYGNIYNSDFWDIWNSQEHKQKVAQIDILKCNTYDCRFHKYNKILEELKEGNIFI
jgi:MoaA/NifB/PqqE/SkfB family radical SAM enzyme